MTDESFPAQGYKDNVLAQCFADAQALFLEHYIDVDRAHALMLAETGIIADDECSAVLAAIETIDTNKLAVADYDGSVEDMFFYLQREIAEGCRLPAAAGKLHTARSRNDIDVTIYRLALRRKALDLCAAAERLRAVLLELSARHHETLMPAHTHTQPAQPTTLAHFLLAMIENVSRDIKRLHAAYWNLNRCPLGACAITTTGFPIDRERVAELLGFSDPTRNSYGSIASVDYFTELLGAVATLLVNVGKFAQEFLLMAMVEFDVLRLPDGYVQASSIMPQKRNPVAMEHVRAIASKGLGQAQGVMTSIHNTPFGDINDVEDDLQPLIHAAVDDAIRSVSLLGHTLEAATFEVAKLRRRASENFITVTELADELVRRDGLSFKSAHAIVSRCVAMAIEGDGTISYAMLQTASEEVGHSLSLDAVALERVLSAENFVRVRTVHGGPAPDETRAAWSEQRRLAQAGAEWLDDRERALDAARARLSASVAAALAGPA